MATIVSSRPAPVLNLAASDRRFYTRLSIIMALTVFAGFAPTYYAKPFTGGPMLTITQSPFSPIVHIHGFLFSAWVVLFVVQTSLVATRRVAVHRKLGVAAGFLAVAMFVAGLSLAISGTARGVAPPGIDARSFLAVPFFDMVLFAVFVTAAFWKRREKEAHKRLMLLAYISIITAAVARLPGVLPLGPLAFYGLTVPFLIAGIAYDWFSRRTVHPVYRWGGTLFILSVPGRLALSGTAAWHSFAQFLVDFVKP
jgi:hypothetical protein